MKTLILILLLPFCGYGQTYWTMKMETKNQNKLDWYNYGFDEGKRKFKVWDFVCGFLTGVIIFLLILISLSVKAQTHTSILTEIGTTDFKSQSYAWMIGFTNFQEDSFHAGLLYKNYGSANRVGVRVNVNLNLNALMFVFIQSDIFGKVPSQDNASFMENSAGLGFRLFKGLSGHLGYQMEDYNPVTKIRLEDRALVKLGYKIRL